MATLTIRNLDDDLKARLRVEAAQHGRSMEEEVRLILKQALEHRRPERGMGGAIQRRFAALGGIDLALAARSDAPRAADLEQ